MVRIAGILLMALLLLIPNAVFAAKTHKVKKNETIASLAKKYHVPVNDLKEANNRLNSSIKPGDVLVIPPRGSKSTTSASTSAPATTYKVKKSETLSIKPGQILALYDGDVDIKPGKRAVAKPALRYADLLNEKEYEQSLTELLDQDSVGAQAQINPDFTKDNVELLKAKAYGFLGTRYRFGGTSKNGLDCSAFVQQVFDEMEVSLPRTAREQFEHGEVVARGDMQKGDLVFFTTYASFPSHVGIYLGNNRMIHASSREHRVVISSLDTPYYRARFIGAKRIPKISPEGINLDELMLGVEEEFSDDAQKNDLLGIDTAKLP